MISEVIIGVIVALIAYIIVYVFKISQLYISVTRLFLKTKLSDNGNIVEINIYNQSKMMEEDIVINLNNELKYEILSTSFDDLELNGNKLSISRLSPLNSISVLLLIENGNFSKTDIKSISSKTTKGKIINKEDLPLNYGYLLMLIILGIFLSMAPIVLFNLYNNYQLEETRKEYQFLEKKGFYNYDEYLESKTRKSYSKTEFPIYQISKIQEEDIIILEYRLINNLATEMEIYIEDTNYLKDFKNIPYKYNSKLKEYHIFKLKPKEYKDIKINIYSPKNSKRNDINLNYIIEALDEYFIFSEKIYI